MFGINSNRCENQKTCAFYSFIEGKIPDTPLRPLTQQEQLLDQNKKQMQTFMVGLAGAFMETLKEHKAKAEDKQGANTNNAMVDLVEYADFIMEIDVNDPEYLYVYLPIEEETFGDIRTEDVVDSNNNNRHGRGSSSEEEEHSEIRQEDSQEESARQYEAWLRGDEEQETPPMVMTSLEEQEMEQTRRMTRTLLHQLRERVVEIEASNRANLPSTSMGDELDRRSVSNLTFHQLERVIQRLYRQRQAVIYESRSTVNDIVNDDRAFSLDDINQLRLQWDELHRKETEICDDIEQVIQDATLQELNAMFHKLKKEEYEERKRTHRPGDNYTLMFVENAEGEMNLIRRITDKQGNVTIEQCSVNNCTPSIRQTLLMKISNRISHLVHLREEERIKNDPRMKDAEIWTVVKGEDGNKYWEHHTTKERRLLYRKGESTFAHDKPDNDDQGPGDSSPASDNEDHVVPEQDNNNNVTHHEASILPLAEQEETYREIFQETNVTHRYAYCAPGDTRRNYAMVNEPDYNITTPRCVQDPLDDETELINENDILNLFVEG